MGGFDATELAELDALTGRLRDEGWASHVTARSLLNDWHELAGEVSEYVMTVDDYTNDLTARDALDLVLTWASPPLRERLLAKVAADDEKFRAATAEDGGVAIGRYFRVKNKSGWWWRRRPTTGPLGLWLEQQDDG